MLTELKLICSSRRTNKPRDVLLSFIRLVHSSQTETFIITLCPDFHLHGDHLQFCFFFFSGISIKANRHTGPQQLSERLLTSQLYRPQHQTPVKPAARSSSHKHPHPRTSSQKHLTAPPTQSRGSQKSPKTQRQKRTEAEEYESKRCPPLCDGTAASNKPCNDTNAHTLTQLLAAGTKYTLRREGWVLQGGGGVHTGTTASRSRGHLHRSLIAAHSLFCSRR